MTILQHAIAQAAAAGGYQIARSLRFNRADSANLTRTPVNGNRKTWTLSTWVKRTSLGTMGAILSTPYNTNSDGIRLNADGSIIVYSNDGSNCNVVTTSLYRDLSAFFHLLVAVDTPQATASNRVKIYVNGVQLTAFSTASYPAQNYDFNINAATTNAIGRNPITSDQYLNAYLADIRFIDGQALDPTALGEFDANTGVWNPKAYTGTYGTNGFWLKFDDNSNNTATTLGKDSSGNGNNWTPNNFSVTAGAGNDSLVDSPTNYGTDTGAGGEVRGNYCTYNPLKNQATLADGSLSLFNSSTTQWYGTPGTIGVQSGKWYWEFTVTGGSFSVVGLANASYATNGHPGWDANSWGYYSVSGVKYFNAASASYGASYTTNDVIGVAFDADAGTLTFYKNGVSQGVAYTGLTSGPYFPAAGVVNNTTVYLNAGQRPFAYTAPSGFKALCTQNLPTPAIGASASTLASKNFNVRTYTGNGTTTGNTQAITGLGFQPDFVWIKSRSAGTQWHLLNDALRGANKLIYSNDTAVEATVTNVFNSFDSDGFTVAYNSSYASAQSNANGSTYVGWGWNAGNSSVSNTAGSISSTVSANTTAGISVVTYTGNGTAGATVGHGLGAVPRMIIVKNRNSAVNWIVYHANIGAANTLVLNSTAASAADAAWGSTTPTSTVFSLGNTGSGNQSGSSHVAYCFAEVAGFSKFGSYTGNGSSDGPFVYCGFRPRFIMIKNSSATANWTIVDTSRDSYNVAKSRLFPSTSDAENTAADNVDILSNGFKVRVASDTGANTSGNTYIFAAFAEAPFNYARAR